MDEKEKLKIERRKIFRKINSDIISRNYWIFEELNELKKIIHEEDPIVYTWGETNTCKISDIEIAETFLYHLERSTSIYPTKELENNLKDICGFCIIENFEWKIKMILLLRFITCRIAFPFMEDDEKGIFRRILQLILEPISRHYEDEAPESYLHTLQDEEQEDYAWHLLDTLNHTIRTEKHEQEINDIRDSLLQELKERDIELEQANRAFYFIDKKYNDLLDDDRWTTVVEFYNVILRESWHDGATYSKIYMQNETKKTLQKRRCNTLKKGNKSGNYYRVEDIVDVAAHLKFIKSGKKTKRDIIHEIKSSDVLSRTKTELELDGFKMINGQEENNEARAKQGKTGNLLPTHSTPIRTMIETKAEENETTEGNE